ncbi:MAG: toll/interleukin-1 receptor domain-containing protein [Xanthobacteraceae bacterium]|jgi:hypothetical protein
MSAPVFISYSSKDRDTAETICRALEARGLDCWISSRDVHPGENFQEAIVKTLRAARVMVLVFTSNANDSDEIKKELVLAGRYRVTIVPVRVEDVVPNDAFSYEFATRQWIDLFRNWEEEIEMLATQIGHVLRTAKSRDGDGAEAADTPQPRRRFVTRLSNRPLVMGSAIVAVLIVAGGVALYLRAGAQVSPSGPAKAVATLPQSPPPAPSALQQAAAPPPPAQMPPHELVPIPAKSPEEMAWDNATSTGTRVVFADYVKDFSAGAHVQEAQLRIADLILNGPAAGKGFDGAWQTTWTCTNVGNFPGYSYRFTGQVKDGAYHGLKGVKGEPSSLDLNGKIGPDGTGAFFGEIIVGSSVVALGAPRGTPSDFHALAHFDHGSGTGKRIEGRPCSLSFERQ